MTEEELNEQYKDVPFIIESSLKMVEANESVKIYEGEFILQSDTIEIIVNGIVTFDWVVSLGSHFSGQTTISSDVYNAFHKQNAFKIIINGLSFANGFITKTNFGNNNEPAYIQGRISEYATLGDKSIAVEKIIFSVPNFIELYGSTVKKIIPGKIFTFQNRLQLDNDDYLISLDKCQNYKEQKQSLEVKGGYIVQSYGELCSKKGPLLLEETRQIFHCLAAFLTFMNGRRTAAFFLQGIYQNEIIWCDYTSYTVDQFKTAQSWMPRDSIRGINKIWKKFSSLWKDSDNKDFLSSAIHWYVEANSQSGFSEGSIIMVQTALELLYNWWVIEQKKLLVGKDSENINASNKIRLLLSQLNISTKIPNSFDYLKEFVSNNSDIIDAPEAVVQIRNAIVHSQQEKRKKLTAIHHMAIYQALQLSVWYVEMTLLCILEYEEMYFNRCSDKPYAYEAQEIVPWKKV